MNSNYGRLVQPNSKIFRSQFDEMTRLLGVKVKYQFPLDKNYTYQGELKSHYSEPEDVFCIFNEFIDQRTAKKLGWISELQTQMHAISVPYDLHNIQIGCLFEMPSAFDGAEPRLFRVAEISAIQMYPASLTCRLVQEYKTNVDSSMTEMFRTDNFNLLEEGN